MFKLIKDFVKALFGSVNSGMVTPEATPVAAPKKAVKAAKPAKPLRHQLSL